MSNAPLWPVVDADTGLPSDLIEICDHIVSVPAGSMNLAATVNVILYDRVAKQARAA